MIENARNHPNITLDVEGFELHQDDIPEKLLDSIDFWNFQDVVTKLVKFISFLFAINFLVSFNLNMKNTGYSSKNSNCLFNDCP